MSKVEKMPSLTRIFVEKAGEDKELQERVTTAQTVFEGLTAAYRNHNELGEQGRDYIQRNQFGEKALRADFEAERKILGALKSWANESGISLYYRGEELGEGRVGPEDGEKYFATFDGLDGSDNYRKKLGPYGTMVAVAKGQDPTYDDFEIGTVMMPEEGWIVIAIKGFGAYLYEIEEGNWIELKPSDEDYDPERILSNHFYPEEFAAETEVSRYWPRSGSTASSIVAIAVCGAMEDKKFPFVNRGWLGLFEVTRKGNLEQPPIYRIIQEVGGVMSDRSGESIGDKKFKKWEQDENASKAPLLTARNPKVLEGMMGDLKL